MKLTLHDVEDVNALARQALEARLKQWSAHLNEHQREDAHAYLVGVAYRLAYGYVRCKTFGCGKSYPHTHQASTCDACGGDLERIPGYDPSKGLSFSTYAYRMMKLRLADWYREQFGDRRHGFPTCADCGAAYPDETELAKCPACDSGQIERRPPQIVTTDNVSKSNEEPASIPEQLSSVVNMRRLTRDQRYYLRQMALPIAIEGRTIDEVIAKLEARAGSDSGITYSKRSVNRGLRALQEVLA